MKATQLLTWNARLLLVIVMLLFTTRISFAQKQKADKQKTGADAAADAHEKKVRDIVAFLEYVLNTIGSSGTPTLDKEVMITESYSKIFRDAKVQVEDDLDESRTVITNKDIVAYLKDVDFFFQNVRFEFVIDDIKASPMTGGGTFYKVSLTRNLAGTTADGKQVGNAKPRFIEINLNPGDQDLKIVSIYTNEFDEKEALTYWWNQLSYEWKSIFRERFSLADSVTVENIRAITATEELDLGSNRYIQNVEPLSQLLGLRMLNLSATAVTDLTPIRNLSELVELNIANTKISDLSALRYATRLERLNINYTPVTDISVLSRMTELQNLEMAGTSPRSLEPVAALASLGNLDLSGLTITSITELKNLVNLQELDVSGTNITDLQPLRGFFHLTVLNIDSTGVEDLAPLATMQNLQTLNANYTRVSDLAPLDKLPKLERIYCDQSRIDRAKADSFRAANPKVLIVFDSRDLLTWWSTLTPSWKKVLSKMARVNETGSKENMALVTNLDSVDLGGDATITDLEALRKLPKLRTVRAAGTGISDLKPLAGLRELRYLDVRGTPVRDLGPLAGSANLTFLQADNTRVEDLAPLFGLHSLTTVYVDRTTIHDITAMELLARKRDCLVVYKTFHLNRWWSNLPDEWKEVFRATFGNDTTAHRENLHRLSQLTSLKVEDVQLRDLSALSEFVRLEKLMVSGTAIRSIPASENLYNLQTLHVTNSPVVDIEAISRYSRLEDFDISNTAVEDLEPIARLEELRRLNCSGTQIKKLDDLADLANLNTLDCSNTRVSNLLPVAHLPLTSLKCYNTKVTAKEVRKFKDLNPNVNVVFYR